MSTQTIAVGDTVPDATLTESTEFGEACPIAPTKISAAEALKGKRVALFGLPGAYTPTCSARHVPGYVEQHAALKAAGVDEIWCVSVNDGYVMAEWGRAQRAIGKVRMLGDGNGEWARKLGVERDLSASGLGTRMARFSAYVVDGVVKTFNLEGPGKFEVSDAGTMLRQVTEHQGA